MYKRKWSPGQLEEEMVRHAWHLTPGSDALLFDTPPAQRWQAAFAEAGIDAVSYTHLDVYKRQVTRRNAG